MATQPNLDDDDDFGIGGDFTDNHPTHRSGIKRTFGELDDDEDDIFASKKVNSKPEETASGAATGMILALRESLDKSKDDLAQCKMELEAAKSEIQKWHSSFLNDSFIPAGTNPDPKIVVEYVRTFRSSEKSLKEQLEKAKKKESAFIMTFAKREQEIAELKDPHHRRHRSTVIVPGVPSSSPAPISPPIGARLRNHSSPLVPRQRRTDISPFSVAFAVYNNVD